MGISLADYAAQHPQQEPQEQQAAASRSYHDAQQERAEVEQLKESIAQQLQAGTAPEYILYPALKAIGILTLDSAWTEATTKALESVYADLAQQSLLVDAATVAAHRLEAMQAQYKDKARRQLTAQLNGCLRLEKTLQEALRAVDALEPQPEQLEP